MRRGFGVLVALQTGIFLVTHAALLSIPRRTQPMSRTPPGNCVTLRPVLTMTRLAEFIGLMAQRAARLIIAPLPTMDAAPQGRGVM